MNIHDLGYTVGYLTGVGVMISIPVICLWIVLVVISKVLRKVQVAEIVIPAIASGAGSGTRSHRNKRPAGRRSEQRDGRSTAEKLAEHYERWALWKGKNGRRVFLARQNGHVLVELQAVALPEELKQKAVSMNGKIILHLPADPNAREWQTLAAVLKPKRNWTVRSTTWRGVKKATINELAVWLAQ